MLLIPLLGVMIGGVFFISGAMKVCFVVFVCGLELHLCMAKCCLKGHGTIAVDVFYTY